MVSINTHSGKTLLKLAKVAPHIYEQLHEIKRTGWVESGVKNPESVKEHTEALIRLAEELSPYLTEEETDGLIEMLEVHDWPEALHGDEIILELVPDEQKNLKDLKFENERRALEQLTADLPNGEEIRALWLRFETASDPAAVFGRQLDKYQAVELALEYEETQKIPLFEEFLTYSINFIHHPVLLERVGRLKERWALSRQNTAHD